MSFRKVITDFFIEYEPEPPSNVLYLNTPFARANAAAGAQLLEENREAMRQDLRRDLHARRRELLAELNRVDDALSELDRRSHG